MSRVIRFRAYAKAFHRYCDMVMLDEQGWSGSFEDGGDIHVTTDIVLEQDTGVVDACGRSIFENDFIKLGFYIYLVKWSEKDGGWFCYRDGERVYTPLFHCTGEVIGNVNENQDLLKLVNTDL